jgi:hypothetical protein
MHYLTEKELGCFHKLFLTGEVDANPANLQVLMDRGWAIWGDDGRPVLTKDGHDVCVFSLGWRRGDEASDPRMS